MNESDRSWLHGITIFICACLVGVTAVLPWWHTIDAPEPIYAKICRVLAACSALMLLVAVFRPSLRPGSLVIAAVAAMLLPVFVLQIVATRDSAAIEQVIRQDNQAHWLLYTVRQDEVMPYVPWAAPSQKSIPDVFSNAYTALDALETSSYFTQAGWFISVFSGIVLFTTACVLYGSQVSVLIRRCRGVGLVALAIVITLFYGHLLISYLHWNRGRAAVAQGDYTAAIAEYHTAATWDPRWNDDLLYHVELGRLYGRAGSSDDQDYWAYTADSYTKSQDYELAYGIYRDHVTNPKRDGAMLVRYVNALLHMGIAQFNAGRTTLAVRYWQMAVDVDPSNVQALYFLGIGQSRLADYAHAVRTWKSLIRVNESVGMFRLKSFTTRDYRKPITSVAWNNMAWCYYQLRDYDMAMACRFNSTVQGQTHPEAFPDPPG